MTFHKLIDKFIARHARVPYSVRRTPRAGHSVHGVEDGKAFRKEHCKALSRFSLIGHPMIAPQIGEANEPA